MGLSRKDAYGLLELPDGSDAETVRSSYMRLARKYYPNGDTNADLKRFKAISKAYKRLTDDTIGHKDSEEEIQMSIADMITLFQLYSSKMGYHNGLDCSDEDFDDDYDDDDDDDEDGDDDYVLSDKFRKIREWGGLENDGWTYGHGLTPEQIEKNANELITEEEKEKRKAEKRRAKKKRRREKKRQEKIADAGKTNEEPNTAVNGKASQDNTTSSKKSKKDKKKDKGSEDEESFDPNAAFFTKVISKKKKAGVLSDPSNKGRNRPTVNAKPEDDQEEMDQIVLRSRQLAMRGNQMANIGEYAAAIDLFSEAIKLDPNDFRFFGNRSYCYDRIQQYDKALRDANKAIELSADWPKGYFRKGRALAGLKQFAEAEQAFMQVLKLDKNCDDANQELLRVRTHQLMEMGFTRPQAEAGIRTYGSVQQALDSLLSGLVADNTIGGEVYISDEEDESPVLPAKANKTQSFPLHPVFTQAISTTNKASDAKMDPTNPEGLTALWVGNVLPEVSDKKLQQMFSKFGTVTSVRCLPEKFCAFVNYKTKEAAGKAMQGLQGVECGGQRLLIKFPDNPITATGQTMIKKPTTPAATNNKQPQNPKPAPKVQPVKPSAGKVAPKQEDKVTGPVNGDECYFWRTTGCQFGKQCHYKHIPSHKGVDKKPWHHS